MENVCDSGGRSGIKALNSHCVITVGGRFSALKRSAVVRPSSTRSTQRLQRTVVIAKGTNKDIVHEIVSPPESSKIFKQSTQASCSIRRVKAETASSKETDTAGQSGTSNYCERIDPCEKPFDRVARKSSSASGKSSVFNFIGARRDKEKKSTSLTDQEKLQKGCMHETREHGVRLCKGSSNVSQVNKIGEPCYLRNNDACSNIGCIDVGITKVEALSVNFCSDSVYEFVNEFWGKNSWTLNWNEIYTEWANHYLEKARCKKQIHDLQVDVTDGVVLADVLEAVTNQKVPDLHKKPKTSSQMLDNIQSCLHFLTNLGVSLEGINARDIRDGHLKSILSLFFQLSRFKQQQKQQDRDRVGASSTSGTNQKQRQPVPASQNCISTNQTQAHNMIQQRNNQHISPQSAPYARHATGSAIDHSKLSSSLCRQGHTSIPLPASGGGVNGEHHTPTQLTGGNTEDRTVPTSSSPYLASFGAQHQQHHSFPQNHGHGGVVTGTSHKKPVTSNSSVYHCPDKGRGLIIPGHPGVALNGSAIKSASGNSSRSTSPSQCSTAVGGCGNPHSFIPQPKSSSSIPSAPSSARSSIHEKHIPSVAKNLAANGVPHSVTANPSAAPTLKSNQYRIQNNNTVNSSQHNVTNSQLQVPTNNKASGGNSSMLEKFKFFKDKDKTEKGKGLSNVSGSSNKRTSSSSGFSSARSEKSDSSVSLSSETKRGQHEGNVPIPATSPSNVILRNRKGDNNSKYGQIIDTSSSGTSFQRQATKGFRQKLGKSSEPSTNNKDSSRDRHSASSSPRSLRKESLTESLHSRQSSNGSSVGDHRTSSSTSGHLLTSNKKSTSRSSNGAMAKNKGNDASVGAVSDSHGFGTNASGASSSASFLRNPKPTSANTNTKDSKNRISGSGIPTRNSLIDRGSSTAVNNLTNSLRSGSEECSVSVGGNNNFINMNNATNNNINNNINNSVLTDSITSTSSSTGTTTPTIGVLQNLGNGTGIPKPTAAVKGTTKQSCTPPNLQNPKTSSSNTCQSENYCLPGNKKPCSKGENSDSVSTDIVESNSKGSSKSPGADCGEETKLGNDYGSLSSKKLLHQSEAGSTEDNSVSSSMKSLDGGITVALVSPMPSLTNSCQTASMSSVEGGNVGLSQSQLSTGTVSQSNSSDASVMLASKYGNILSCAERQRPTQSFSNEINASTTEQSINEINVDLSVENINSSSTSHEASLYDEMGGSAQKNASSVTENSKTSLGCISSTSPSRSSSIGSLQKFASENRYSSPVASLTSLTNTTNAPEDKEGVKVGSFQCSELKNEEYEQLSKDTPTIANNRQIEENSESINASHENGNSVIVECEEDELMVNVKPMEPLMRNCPYEYIKSPPGLASNTSMLLLGHQQMHGGNSGLMRRTVSCENGNRGVAMKPTGFKTGVRQGYGKTNPYFDPSRQTTGRRITPDSSLASAGSLSTSGHGSSCKGDYDYAYIDNLDIDSNGYVSDGDLVSGVRSMYRQHDREQRCLQNDGYMSESGVTTYGRRSNGSANGRRSSSHMDHSRQYMESSRNTLITEESFDDSSSISSGISDLNEVPTDLTSSSVNSDVSSPYASLQRDSGRKSNKGLNKLSAPTSNSGRELNVSQNNFDVQLSDSIIYRVVGTRNTSRRSDTGDPKSSTLSSGYSAKAKVSNLSHNHTLSQYVENRSATLPVGFNASRSNITSKGVQYKHGHLLKNLRSSESSSSLRPALSPSNSVGAGSIDHGPTSGGRGTNGRVVKQHTSSGIHASSISRVTGSDQYSHGSSNAASTAPTQQIRSMNSSSNLKTIPNDATGPKGMMGIKEAREDGVERQHHGSRGSGGSSESSSSSSGGEECGRRNSSATAKGITQNTRLASKNSPAVPVSGGIGGYGFIRRSSANASSAKYAVPVTTVSSNGKVTITGMVREQTMMTQEEYKQALAAAASAAAATQISPYSVITTIQQQRACAASPVNQSPKTRTKVKVSGGTQTTNDLHDMTNRGGNTSMYAHHQHHHGVHYHHSQTLPGHVSSSNVSINTNTNNSESEYAASTSSRNSGSFAPPSTSSSQQQIKSMSLTSPTAAQLSQSLRERILGSQSLPKGATSSADYAAILATIQHQQQVSQIYGTPTFNRDRMSRYAGVAKNTMNDGSMSDAGCGYATYSEIYASTPGQSGPNTASGGTPYSWMRHSTGYASSNASAPTRLLGAGGSMTEAESMESLSSTCSLAAQLRDARANSLTQGRLPSCVANRDQQASPSRSPRLNRSNSIRSTKSEKLYPSMLQRNEDANPYYSSTMSAGGAPTLPTSPIHGAAGRLCSNAGNQPGGGVYSSTASASSNHSIRLSMSPYSGFVGKLSTKEDEINASSLSLVSTASSLYSSQDDKHAHEVRKLRRELAEAQEKVQTLTNQLTTNAHVVAAFEQSLSNMTQRLQTLTLTAEQKDSELTELRQTIELLRKQSVEAGLTVAKMTRHGACGGPDGDSLMARQLSADSVSSINSISSTCSGTSHSHTSTPMTMGQNMQSGTPTHSASRVTPDSPGSKKKHPKGKGWLRSSFSKAFSRSKGKSRSDSSPEHCTSDGLQFNNDGQFASDMSEDYSHQPTYSTTYPYHVSTSHANHQHRTIPQHFQSQQQPSQNTMRGQIGNSVPTSPLLSPPNGESRKNSSNCNLSVGSHSPLSHGDGGSAVGSNDGRSVQGSSTGLNEEHIEEPRSVDELKKQLREKEMVLTDIRLEALTSAHQLESLKETVNKMRNEMLSLKQDNERLQRMVTCKSLTSSQNSLLLTNGTADSVDRRLSASEVPPPSSTTLEMFLTGDVTEKEGKQIVVTVYLGSHGCYERYTMPLEGLPAQECIIGTINVGNKTNWDALDSLVKRAFKDYLMRIDPVSSLGLNADSVLSYAVGEVLRTKDGSSPELLPCGYLVGDVTKIRICLRGALNNSLDALVFETLVPKSVLQRYMGLLSDNGRIIICGTSGTGKSYLARKLGEYLVAESGKEPCPEAIASFSADHKNSKELRHYLTNLAEQCDGAGEIDLPSVIILDNLHQVANLGDVFNGWLLNSAKNSKDMSKSPIIIGTMTQTANAPPTAMQVHHHFRWVLFSSHTEPVKGLLGRHLQRRLIEVDVQNGTKNLELARIVDWIPKVWHHINKFLEAHNSAEVTIGPRLFLSCPMDVANSQVWFTDLWHYSVVPYLIEATKEGLQVYGQKSAWDDPVQYLLLTYPWSQQLSTGKSSTLQRIRPEDVGYDTKAGVNGGSNGEGNKAASMESSGDPSDPLMSMLMRLQEAANYSGPQSNDSDSTSLDSHVSLDPKDFNMAS